MSGFVIRGFAGMRPISNAKLLGPSEAQSAADARLFSGAIEPVRDNEVVTAIKSSSNVKTIFRVRENSDESLNWFEFADDVDVVLSPITQDEYKRVYWTGDGVPKYATDLAAFASGSGEYPRGSYSLGIPKPAVDPSATGTALVEPATQEREYVITFSNSDGSKQSGISGVVKAKALEDYHDMGTLYPSSFAYESSTSYVIEFEKEHELDVGDYIGITGASDSGWNQEWKVSSIVNVKSVKIENTSTFPSAAPSGSYSVKQRYMPSVRLYGLPTDTNNQASITHKRIYRKVGSSYKLVASIGIDITEYIDSATDSDLSAAASLIDSIRYRPSRPSTAPVAQVPFDDETIATNLASQNPVSEETRAYAVSYVTYGGIEGPLSRDSGVVSVVPDQTQVRVTHIEDYKDDIEKKRIYRQAVTYTDGAYNLPESSYKLVREVPVSQDLLIDYFLDSEVDLGDSPSVQDAFDPPETFIASATLPPTVTAETRVYVYTYVSEYGEEGPPSSPSIAIDVNPREPVTVSTGSAPTGNFNITKKYIYRTSTSTSSTDYQFVAEQPVATTSFTDNFKQVELGEVIPSKSWIAPVSDMFGLRLMANGILVGFSGKDVCFSEPFMPHAWPSEYRLTLDYEIVGGGAFGQSVAILTKSHPYIATGVDPMAISLVKTSMPQACVSKRSIVETGNSVIYASPDGLVQISMSGMSVITSKILSQDQWQEYQPSSIHGYLHEGRYIAFYTKLSGEQGSIAFSLDGSDASMILGTEYTDAATLVPIKDALHAVVDGNIVMLDKGTSLKTYSWRSKIYESPNFVNFGAGQVVADSYSTSVTFKLYGDGSLRHTQAVTSSEPFRLPSGYMAKDWYIELEGSTKVSMVAISQSINELKAL